MTLAQSPIGFLGSIKELKGEETVVARLRELGFIRGEPIHFWGKAPMGEPLLVEVRGVTVALRKGEAECIQL